MNRLAKETERRNRHRSLHTVQQDFEIMRTLLGLHQIAGDQLSRSIVEYVDNPTGINAVAVAAARKIWTDLRKTLKGATNADLLADGRDRRDSDHPVLAVTTPWFDPIHEEVP